VICGCAYGRMPRKLDAKVSFYFFLNKEMPMFKEKINKNKKEMPKVLNSSLGASIYGFF
jgi:hypothetical protein